MTETVTFLKNSKGRFVAVIGEVRPTPKAKSSSYFFMTDVKEDTDLSKLVASLDKEDTYPVVLHNGIPVDQKLPMMKAAEFCIEAHAKMYQS